MNKNFKLLAVGATTQLAVMATGTNVALAADTGAKAVGNNACKAAPNAIGCAAGTSLLGTVLKGIQVLLLAVGVVSVIMVIVGGLRYTLSAGDSSATKGAKDTILYAIIGVVVATAGYAIMSFVAGRIAP